MTEFELSRFLLAWKSHALSAYLYNIERAQVFHKSCR